MKLKWYSKLCAYISPNVCTYNTMFDWCLFNQFFIFNLISIRIDFRIHFQACTALGFDIPISLQSFQPRTILYSIIQNHARFWGGDLLFFSRLRGEGQEDHFSIHFRIHTIQYSSKFFSSRNVQKYITNGVKLTNSNAKRYARFQGGGSLLVSGRRQEALNDTLGMHLRIRPVMQYTSKVFQCPDVEIQKIELMS